MTQILALPTLSFPVTVRNNENWSDAWGWVDATGAAISGAGIDLALMLRLVPGDTDVLFAASTIPGLLNGVVQNGTISWVGPNQTLIQPNIPQSVIASIPVGGPYYAEVLGIADGNQRVLSAIAFTVAQGIVR